MRPNWLFMVLFRCVLWTFFIPCFSCYLFLKVDYALLSFTHYHLFQHYIKLQEPEKNRKLNDLLDALDFNQVVIFVKSVSRAAELNKLLVECNFPSICIHSGMSQEERYFMFFRNWWHIPTHMCYLLDVSLLKQNIHYSWILWCKNIC